jgi:hypothetical protein
MIGGSAVRFGGKALTRREFAKVAGVVGVSAVCGAAFDALAGCQGAAPLSPAARGEGYTTDYSIAVVKSNVISESTFVEYYDESLSLVNKLEYPYSTLENSWGKPERFGDEVYLANQGVEGIRQATTVVGINTKTGAVREYDAGIRALKNCTANENYVFASRNLNAKSDIVRIDKQTGERHTANYPGLLYPFAYEDKIYAFNTDVVGKLNQTALLILDEDLELLNTIEFGENSHLPQATGFIGDRLWFVLAYEASNATWADTSWNICSLLHNTPNVETIATETGKRLGNIALLGDALCVLISADIAAESRNNILLRDSYSGNFISEYPLAYEPKFVHQHNGTIFAAGYDDKVAHDLMLGAYKMNADGVLFQTNEVHTANHESDRQGRYYLTGLFAVY